MKLIMLPYLAQLLFMVQLLRRGLPLGSATQTKSLLGEDPSCVTFEVVPAPAARSNSECAAVLISTTLVASTTSCATDAELVMVVEGTPRDLNTYGGMDNFASMEGNQISWTLPTITVDAPLTVEFVIDLCDFCDKYGGRDFNPIDSFHYTDAEGNEPNERMDAYKLKIPCDGLQGGAIDSVVATPAPTPSPTRTPTPSPTKAPTPLPTKAPTLPPTKAPTPPPTKAPTPAPTNAPVPPPTTKPTISPTKMPTTSPSPAPTLPPTEIPTTSPSEAPTLSPTKAPTKSPTMAPTQSPTKAPTLSPTEAPTQSPTRAPTISPTRAPTRSPTIAPTQSPTKVPTHFPTKAPAPSPTKAPTQSPTRAPTLSPTKAPTPVPTVMQTEARVVATGSPGDSVSSVNIDTGAPTMNPSGYTPFSFSPTTSPTAAPTSSAGESLRGMTLSIQSVFEGRRRALEVDPSAGKNEIDARRALSVVYQEDAEEYDMAMVHVCAAAVGVEEERIISVFTDFGAEGPMADAARRVLQISTRSSTSSSGTSETAYSQAIISPSQLTPVTTCEVDLTGGDDVDTRSMTAAAMVDTLFSPEKFVLLLDENRFGPVNAAVSSIAFWQKECPDDTCPASDGSYASVFPLNEAESQSTVLKTPKDEEIHLLGFIGLGLALVLLACCSWLVFCLCCAGSRSRSPRPKKPKQTIENRYSVQNSWGSDPSPSSEEDGHCASGSVPSETRVIPPPISTERSPTEDVVEPLSPGEAHWRRMFGLRPSSHRSAPISPMRTHSNGSGSVASGSKGHSVGSNPFFANDHSDHSGQFKAEKKEKRILIRADGVRSDGISGSGSSKGSGSGRENNSGSNSGTNSGSNSDVNSGGNNGASHSGGSSSDGGLVAQSPQPSTSTKDTRDEGVSWKVSRDLNDSEKRKNDPVIRRYAGGADSGVRTPVSSPRKELNRLREALNKPSRGSGQSFNSTSPTATVSSQSQGQGSCSTSPNVNLGSGQFVRKSPSGLQGIHENDLEAAEDGDSSAVQETGEQPVGADTDSKDSNTPPSGRSDLSTSTYSSGDSGSATTFSGETRPKTLAAAAASAAATVGIPCSSFRPGVVSVSCPAYTSPIESRTGSSPASRTDATTPKTSENKTAESPQALRSNDLDETHINRVDDEADTDSGEAPGKASSARSLGNTESENSACSGEPPSMPPLPPNTNQLVKKDAQEYTLLAATTLGSSRTPGAGGDGDGSKEDENQVEEIRSAAVLDSSESKRATPLGGVLSNFACLRGDQASPCATPRNAAVRSWCGVVTPGSRLPEDDDNDRAIDDEPSVEGESTALASSRLPPRPPAKDKDDKIGVRVGGGNVAAGGRLTLERALAISRSRSMSPELTPVAEGESEDKASTDSETESEISSRASPLSSVGGSRHASRDSNVPSRARQIASIPPPSAGSPGTVGVSLAVVSECSSDGMRELSPRRPPYPTTSTSPQGRGYSGHTSPDPPALVTPTLSIPSPCVRPPASDSHRDGQDHHVTNAVNALQSAKSKAKGDLCGGWGADDETTTETSKAVRQSVATTEVDNTLSMMMDDVVGGVAQGVEKKADLQETTTIKEHAEDETAEESETFRRVAAGLTENFPPVMDDVGSKAEEAQVKDNSRKDAREGQLIAGDDMPYLESPAAALPETGMSTIEWTPQPSLPAPPPPTAQSRDKKHRPEDDHPPVFSLTKSLSAFLWKKQRAISQGNINFIPRGQGVPPVEDVDDEAAPVEGITVSPSQSLTDWAESKVEDPLVHELESSPAEIYGLVATGEGQKLNEVSDNRQPKRPHLELPSLAVTLCDDMLESPGDSPFNRAAMNLQSPEPRLPQLPMASMPDLPKASTSTLADSVNITSPEGAVTSENPDFSPRYDREAIVRSMSVAEEEPDGDGESDIQVPSKLAWPSARLAASGARAVLADGGGSSGSGHSPGRAPRMHGDSRRTSSSGNYYRYHDCD